jgi:outer membrane protein assembly factor BamB
MAASLWHSTATCRALPQVLWTSNTSGSDGFSSPAIGSDGTLYIGSSDGSLHAIVATGGRGQAQYVGDSSSWRDIQLYVD